VTADLFRPISFYKKVPPASFPGLDRYIPGALPVGRWPAPLGGAARVSCSGEPLVHDQWRVLWEAQLDGARAPEAILVGPEVVVVVGADHWKMFSGKGRRIGEVRRTPGASLLDVDGHRLLAADPGGGVGVFTTGDARRDSSLMLAFPDDHPTMELLDGPGALVLVSVHAPAHGSAEVVVETVRIRDYANKKNDILYGIEPLAGILRADDRRIRAAAARTGPVLATRDGVLWCDWQLKPLHEHRFDSVPLALSVDGQDRACLLSSNDGVVRLRIIPPGGPIAVDMRLPWVVAAINGPPIVTPNGQVYLAPRDAVMALSPTGQVVWQQTRSSAAPASVTANGILLLADDRLYAVTPDGTRRPIWRPAAPIATRPVLAGGRLHVATENTVYVLEPALS
jgi:hypothetical protein